MEINELIRFLYSEKQILTQRRNIDELEFSSERARLINRLMDRKIFDGQYIAALQSNTPYSEIEKCYVC